MVIRGENRISEDDSNEIDFTKFLNFDLFLTEISKTGLKSSLTRLFISEDDYQALNCKTQDMLKEFDFEVTLS